MKKIMALLLMMFILLVATISFTLGQRLNIPSKEESDIGQVERFDIYTSAVCEEKEDHIYCHDEQFVNCGEVEYMLQTSNILGFAVFDKDWKDPRLAQ